MRKVKALIKELLPPIVLRAIRRHSGMGIRFHGPHRSWQDAQAASSGYDRDSILAKVKAATLKVKRGEAAYERDSVVFERIEYAWEVLSALLWTATQDAGRLHVLDFGGSLGSSYFQNRVFLARLTDVRWGVVEQPHYVACGRAEIQDDRLRFYDSIDACVAETAPNAILLSSVIQYLPNCEETLTALAATKAQTIIFDRTIVANGTPGIYVQSVPRSIYEASYPVWSLSEEGLVGQLTRAGYGLVTDFDNPEFPALEAIGATFKGYVFARR